MTPSTSVHRNPTTKANSTMLTPSRAAHNSCSRRWCFMMSLLDLRLAAEGHRGDADSATVGVDVDVFSDLDCVRDDLGAAGVGDVGIIGKVQVVVGRRQRTRERRGRVVGY